MPDSTCEPLACGSDSTALGRRRSWHFLEALAVVGLCAILLLAAKSFYLAMTLAIVDALVGIITMLFGVSAGIASAR